MVIEDSELQTVDEEDTKVFDRPMAYISNEMFDAARGKPATIRPPPTEGSVSIVDVIAKGRSDLVRRISKSVNRKLQFDDNIDLETIQNITEVICNRKWLTEPSTMRAVILHFLRAFEPDTYAGNANVEDKNGEELADLFLAVLVHDVNRPFLAQSLSRKRLETPLEIDLEALEKTST